jgi:hypothetical protein
MNAARTAALLRATAKLHAQLARLETTLADELAGEAAPDKPANDTTPPKPKPSYTAPDGVNDRDRERGRRALERRGKQVRTTVPRR